MRHPVSARPRKVPKQERSKATVEAILEATARVLVHEGYEGTITKRSPRRPVTVWAPSWCGTKIELKRREDWPDDV